MIGRAKIRNSLVALAGAVLVQVLAGTTSAEAGYRDGWGGYRPIVVHRHVVHRPVVHRVVYVRRPVYRPHRIVRRVVIVERPFYPRARYAHGWPSRVGYRPGWHDGRWHDRRRCFLPERYLCR